MVEISEFDEGKCRGWVGGRRRMHMREEVLRAPSAKN